MDTPAVSLRRLLLGLLLLLSTVGRSIAQHACEHCNCQISSEAGSQAIYNMALICNTGTISWYGASGAIRLELTPFVRGHFRACFVVESNNTHVKISQENLHKDRSANYRLNIEEERTLKLDHVLTSTAKSNEFCIDSESSVPLLLYIEAVRTPGVAGVPKVLFHYDVEKVHSKILKDPMEECRPCTKQEILDAYCSMDFVVVGSMTSVSHNDAIGKTEVEIAVSQLIHQKDKDMFYRAKRSDRHLTGHVTVPRKCGIKHGAGEFLMTGKVRLGQLSLKCVPFLDEWREIQHEAECSHG